MSCKDDDNNVVTEITNKPESTCNALNKGVKNKAPATYNKAKCVNKNNEKVEIANNTECKKQSTKDNPLIWLKGSCTNVKNFVSAQACINLSEKPDPQNPNKKLKTYSVNKEFGNCTIGYGVLLKNAVCSESAAEIKEFCDKYSDFKTGMCKITKEQGDTAMKDKMNKILKTVLQKLKKDGINEIEQSVLDALADGAYNGGAGGVKKFILLSFL